MVTDELVKHVAKVWGQAGADWLNRLPAVLAEIEERWCVESSGPFDSSYHYVAPAVRDDGSEGVLKLEGACSACRWSSVGNYSLGRSQNKNGFSSWNTSRTRARSSASLDGQLSSSSVTSPLKHAMLVPKMVSAVISAQFVQSPLLLPSAVKVIT